MEGQLDQCDMQVISGWAWNAAAPEERATLEILDGDRVVGTVVAQDYRADLEAAQKGDGHCAFQWRVPPQLLDSAQHEIHVRFQGTEVEIGASPKTVQWDAGKRHQLAEELRGTMRALPWEISNAVYKDGQLTIQGWAIPPLDGRETSFLIQGRRFERVQHHLDSERIGDLYWYWPGSDRCGFECALSIDPAEIFRGGRAELHYIDSVLGTPFDTGQIVFWPQGIFDHVGVPPVSNIKRTSGYSDAHLYLQEGFTAFLRLQLLLKRLHGEWPQGATLDWGSGCARVTRWLVQAQLPEVEVHGGDIDAANVRWCQDSIDHANFQVLPLHPPSPYQDGQFQVIYGLSVFTHLQEDVQFAWLEELARIAAPGATLLLTVHGDASYCLARPDMEWLERLRAKGFDASIQDGCLAGQIEDDTYYRATFHTHDYVREHWGQFFEVVEILEGFVCHQQDMVVLRKRT